MIYRLEGARIGCIAALVVAAATLSGCGTAPTSLRPVAQPAALKLQSPVRWVRPMTFNDLQEYLAPGIYAAVGESDEGTYYLGPSPCLAETYVPKDRAVQPKNSVARNCGIFVPRASVRPPTVFFVADGAWNLKEFEADGTPRLDRVGQHFGVDFQPDGVRPGTPPAQAASSATLTVNPAVADVVAHPTMATGAGAGIGAGIVGAIVAADAGTYHDAPAQPPAGWLNAALTPATTK
jgi:hypothetical protein